MKLMPTIIAAGARANVDATPIARRLDIAFPDADPGNSTRTDQYLLADDLLVAPCSQWTANGSSTRKVWIPPGRWQDTWSGVTIAGPKLITVTQPLARVPMWHRRGGLVCTAPVAQTVEEQDWSTLGLEVFPFDLNGDLDDSSGPSQHVLRRSVTREGEPGGTTITMTQVGGNVTVTVFESLTEAETVAGGVGATRGISAAGSVEIGSPVLWSVTALTLT
jgi:alpha-glucosidase (family GH31 glycosyl hydrolase)